MTAREVPAPVRPVPPRSAPARPGVAAAARPAVVRLAVSRPPVYRGLPRPARIAVWSLFGVAAGFAVGSTAPGALRGLGATLALQPGILPWYAVRAFGFLAYLAFAGSVVYGLMLSTKLLDAIAHRPVSVTLHKDLAIAGCALSVLHGGLLLADHTFAFSLAGLLVPFRSPYAPVAVGVGQLGFYLTAVITVSFYVRRRIGQRAWRLLHYLTFAGFVAVTAHGIAAGTDTSQPWAFGLYVAPAAAVVFLFGYRVTAAVAARADRPAVRPEAVRAEVVRLAVIRPATTPPGLQPEAARFPAARSTEPTPMRRGSPEPSFD